MISSPISQLRQGRSLASVRFLVALTSLLLLLSLANPVGAQTVVSGTINTDSTWSASDSPIILTGNVIVDAGATLTIAPGTEVHFTQRGTGGTTLIYSLTIDGTLLATGAHFWSGNTSRKGGSIVLNSGSANSVLDDVLIEEMNSLRLSSSSAMVRNSTIRNNRSGGISIQDASPTIINTAITDNSGSGIGISGDAAPTITDCVISGTTGLHATSELTQAVVTGTTIHGGQSDVEIHPMGLTDFTNTTFSRVKLIGATITRSSAWPTAAIYKMTSDITVVEGVTLTMKPGVEVHFRGKKGFGFVNFSLDVEGTLLAEGTSGTPVRFWSGDENNPGGSINLNATSTNSVLAYLDVEASTAR